MRSHQLLGLLALGAIAVAAISLGALDFEIGAANGCMDGVGGCRATTLPPCAGWLALIGVAAMLASIAPGVQWLRAVRRRTSEGDAGKRR